MDTDAVQVGSALLDQRFTVDGVLGLIGAEAFAALGRGEAGPARHVLADRPDEALTDLIRICVPVLGVITLPVGLSALQ